MFADAKSKISSTWRVFLKIPRTLESSEIGWGQISRSTNYFRKKGGKRIKALLTKLTSGCKEVKGKVPSKGRRKQRTMCLCDLSTRCKKLTFVFILSKLKLWECSNEFFFRSTFSPKATFNFFELFRMGTSEFRINSLPLLHL